MKLENNKKVNFFLKFSFDMGQTDKIMTLTIKCNIATEKKRNCDRNSSTIHSVISKGNKNIERK